MDLSWLVWREVLTFPEALRDRFGLHITLVVDLGRTGYVMVLMPGNKNIDLRSLARSYSVKRAAMADTSTAERLTGYSVGGISPFETKQNLSVVMEASLLRFDKVAVNAGKRGLMAIMAPKDLLWLVNGDVLTSIGETD